MTREEAINKVRQMSLPKETMEILQALAPELKESEDERIKEQIEQALIEHDWSVTYKVGKDDCLAWLEKQKEQKPAEWSEEDEAMLEQAIKCVNNSGKLEVSTEEIEDWLKSLRSRPKTSNNWKPSEEQMAALNRCILIGNEDMIYALNSLCDDLKKLK